MAHDKEVERVKLVGPLWTTKVVLSIVRDILLIVFLIAAIIGVIFMVSSLSGVLDSVGGVGGLGGLLGLSNTMQTIGESGPEAVVQGLQQDINNNDWESASAKVEQLQFIVSQMGNPPEAVYALQQLKQGIKEKDKAKVYQVLAQVQNADSNR